MDPNIIDNLPPKPSQEEEILELAKKELLRDIKCASIRAEQFGAHSWAKPQKYVPSKRFLKHMIINDSKFNDRKEQRSIEQRKMGRSRHSSSYVRRIEDQNEKSSRNDFFHSGRSKKIALSSEDEGNRNKSEKSYRENIKYSGRKTKKFSKILPNELDRGVKKRRDESSPEKEKHSRKKVHKNDLLVIDEKSKVSTDEEDNKNKNLHYIEKEKQFKRKKHRNNFPSETDNELSGSLSKHDETIKNLSSDDDKEISSSSRNRKKHSKKHSKKKKSK